MTPQREKYLAKIGKKEEMLREIIAEYKAEIKWFKEVLTNGYDFEFDLGLLRWRKFHLMLFKHELARLKGMDRVVRAKEFQEVGSQGLSRCSKCGEDLSINERFCSACGRKILWEKVKQCD